MTFATDILNLYAYNMLLTFIKMYFSVMPIRILTSQLVTMHVHVCGQSGIVLFRIAISDDLHGTLADNT